MPRALFLLPLIVGFAACDANRTTADEQVAATDPQATATASPAAPAVPGVQPGAELPLTAQAFVDAVAAGNNFEMESARIVQGSGPPEPLRAFTQMILRDHQTASERLKEAANAASISAFPDEQKLTTDHQANLAALRAARGPQLHDLYLRQQIAAHEKTLAILRTYGQSGDSRPLMNFANQSVPLISRHLEEARKLP